MLLQPLLLRRDPSPPRPPHPAKRTGFSTAAPPQQAEQLFDYLVEQARKTWPQTATGRFGADMQVHLVNDGPVTILLET